MIDVHAAIEDFTAAQHLYQFADSVCSGFTQVRIQASFISGGRLSLQSQFFDGTVNTGLIKASGFHDDGVGIVDDFGIQTTHDAGDTDWFFGVVDHQCVCIDISFLAIQSYEFISVFRHIHDDVTARNASDVESMERLTVFHHDEVSNIYHIVNRSHAGCHQAFLQPPRRLLNFYVFDDSGSVTFAVVIFNFYTDII